VFRNFLYAKASLYLMSIIYIWYMGLGPFLCNALYLRLKKGEINILDGLKDPSYDLLFITIKM